MASTGVTISNLASELLTFEYTSGMMTWPFSGSKFVPYKSIKSGMNFVAASTPAPVSHPYTKVKLFEYEPEAGALPPSR